MKHNRTTFKQETANTNANAGDGSRNSQNGKKTLLFGSFCCAGFLWWALGSLVVMTNDEWEHSQAVSTLSTPFNAPLAPRSGALGTCEVWVTRGDAWVN